MPDKPIKIPADIADKCDEPDQFKRFDDEFSRLAANIKPTDPPEPGKPRGRPKKKHGSKS